LVLGTGRVCGGKEGEIVLYMVCGGDEDGMVLDKVCCGDEGCTAIIGGGP
jgi:hypothetical protein